LLAESLDASFTRCAFASLSGLTTTGAHGLLPAGCVAENRFCLLTPRLSCARAGRHGHHRVSRGCHPAHAGHWVAMQLYRAESPGAVKDKQDRTGALAETAKALWYLYLGIRPRCAVAYYLAGMNAFVDAMCHSFSTVAIGGFSTHDASMGYFDSAAIEGVAVIFMIFAGINFGLHFGVFARRSPGYYLRDPEFQLYIFGVVGVATIVCSILYFTGGSDHPLRHGIFQAVSMATTTGFTTTDFSLWPSVAPVLLLFAAFAGGCAGSTAGGIKMIRVLLIYRQGLREIKRLIHPAGVFPLKLAGHLVPDRVIDAVWSFFSVYVILFLTLVCLFMGFSGTDFETSFSAVGASLNNLGPGL
ncbi:UNVERIFIED_CONTAM: hypothetical protein GTU68_025988, partial [Idotea baltica]|nr:hypothetical protein [Idotea baltica]